MLVKVLVLTGDQRVFHVIGDFAQRYQIMMLGPAGAEEYLAVTVHQDDAGIVTVHQAVDVRDVTGEIQIGRDRDDDEECQHGADRIGYLLPER